MKKFNFIGVKFLACVAAAAVLTGCLGWSFIESTAVVRGADSNEGSRNVSFAGTSHGGAPLAPFGASVQKRSATLVG